MVSAWTTTLTPELPEHLKISSPLHPLTALPLLKLEAAAAPKVEVYLSSRRMQKDDQC